MSYFTQFYNYIYDIHPWRPTIEDYKRKNLVIKQIKDMKKFKFKNTKESRENDELFNKLIKFNERRPKIV